MNRKEQIKPETELKDLLKSPQARKVFLQYRLACMKCGGIGKEKLYHAAQCHGIDTEELIRQILDGNQPRE